MGWRRETWVLLAWLVLSVGAFVAISGLGAAGLGLVECRTWASEFADPLGSCGDGLLTLVLQLLVLLVGAVGSLVATVLWLRSRPVRGRCSGCGLSLGHADATCPRCGRDLTGAFGPPPGWGSPGGS